MTVHVVGDPTPLYEEKVSQQQQQIDELEKENKRLKLLLIDQNKAQQIDQQGFDGLRKQIYAQNEQLRQHAKDKEQFVEEREKLLAENRRLAGSVEELQSRNKTLLQTNNKQMISLTQLKQQVLDTNNKLATALTSMKTKAKPATKKRG